MPDFLDDPRQFAAPGDGCSDPLVMDAQASLAAGAASVADAIDRRIVAALVHSLVRGDGARIAAAFSRAPSAVVARQLARRLAEAWSVASREGRESAVSVCLFAVPLVLVVAGEPDGVERELPCALADPSAAAAVLMEQAALRGNRTLTFAHALAGPEDLSLERIASWLVRAPTVDESLPAAIDVVPRAVRVFPGEERAVLRFLVGAVLAAPGVELFAEDTTGWMMPLARNLRGQLAGPGVTLLVLPRQPRAPFTALMEGRAAQRDVAAQLFASNAIRRLRAAVAEPDAVLSAHRCPDATNGGELRLSLSNPFDERHAEGFRCPLDPWERATDVANMLEHLLIDYRVERVALVPGVHPDRDPVTGMRLFFKGDAAPMRALH